MKKILFLLLFTIASYGQAVFDEGVILKGNVATGSTTKMVSQQPTTGELNYVDAVDLPISTATQTDLNLKLDKSLLTDFNKAYISPYTTGSIRNSEGDVIRLASGKLLAVYSRFYVAATDFSPSVIAFRISNDTEGNSWGEEAVLSPDIATLNVLSASLLRVDASSIDCFFLVRNSFTDLELYKTTSTNEGVTWNTAVKITNNGYTDVLNSSVKRVNSDRILISAESTPDGSVGSPTWDIFTYYSDDNVVTYTKSKIVHLATSHGDTSVC